MNLKFEIENLKLKRSGNAWVGILVLLIFVATLGVAIVSEAVNTISQSKRAQQVIVAQALDDAGIDKAIWKLNKTPGYLGENDIEMGTGTIDIAISGTTEKQVLVTAYVPSKANPRVTRKVRATLEASPDAEGIAFRYGIQVGTSGVELGNGTTITGSVYSNSFVRGAGVNKSTITGDAFAVTTVTDVKVNGQTRQNQPPTALPTFDTALWKNLANQNNDPASSCIPSGGHIGPKRINGDCNLSNVIIDGPLYVTGNVYVSGNVSVNNIFGSSGTVIIADGIVDIAGNAVIGTTNATPKGYLLFYTESSASPAIQLGTDMSGGVFFALNGIIHTQPHVNPVSLVAKGIAMQPNGDLHYDAGLALADFSDGPGGSWILKEWQVVQ